MRFFGQHEAAGARQRIKTGFGQCAQLKLAVTIGEVGEHVERQPVRRLFIECGENTRLLGIAGIALQQCFRFFAAVAAKMLVQQIHHRP